MKLTRAQNIELFASIVVAESKHDADYACQTSGPEICHHCSAIKALRRVLLEGRETAKIRVNFSSMPTGDKPRKKARKR